MPSLVGASSGVEAPIQTSPLASLMAVVRPPLLKDEPMQMRDEPMRGQSEVGLSPRYEGEEDEQLDETESLERDREDGDGGRERADDGFRHGYRKGRCG